MNAHTLPVALERATHDQVSFAAFDERQAALALLERVGYPETMAELALFLNVNHALTPTELLVQGITDQHASRYVTWLAGFLNDPEPNTQKNARILLKWLASTHRAVIAANPGSLDGLRRLSTDSDNSWKNAAYIAYALGTCGAPEDYDYVIHQAEIVMEHDKEHADLVAEALYRLYPQALINALQYFLEQSTPNSKQFVAGIYLLAKVAEIDDQQFWNTYYDDMDRLVGKLAEVVNHSPVVERILDLIEKHLALAQDED